MFKQFSLGLKREFILNGRKHFKRCFGREVLVENEAVGACGSQFLKLVSAA